MCTDSIHTLRNKYNAKARIQYTWMLAGSLGVVTLAICIAMQVSVQSTIALVMLMMYLPSYLDGSEKTGDRTWDWFIAFCAPRCAWAEGDITLETPLNKNQQYLFCSHPHGIASVHISMLMTGSTSPPFWDIIPLHNRRHLIAPICFRFPIFREYLLWLGGIDASRHIAQVHLKDKKSLIICVGGIEEQMLSQRGSQVLYIKKRKGHIRLALKYGIPIVPGYAFGETDLYTHSSFLIDQRRKLSKRFSMAFVLAHGWSRFLPFVCHQDTCLHIVYGNPIHVTKAQGSISQRDVDKLHRQYIDEIVRIYGKYKEKFGYKDQQLVLK